MNKKFSVKFAETEKEFLATYKLRNDDMLTEYVGGNASGIDKNEYDDYAKHVIAIDNETGEIIACYRVITSDNLFGKKFVCEEEFNIDGLKSCEGKILELSRAVIKKEYRNGIVLMLLWGFIFDYITKNGYRYLIGDASFNGTDREKYKKEISYLVNNYAIDEKYGITSKDENGNMEILPSTAYDEKKVKQNLPTLIKAYISMGATVSSQPFTDYSFGSVDVFILLDMENCNRKYIEKIAKQ